MDQGLAAVTNALAARKARMPGFEMTPGAETEGMAQDLTPENIQALGQAIDRAKDPRQKAILLEELARIKDLASNLIGPVQRPPMLPGTIPENEVMRAPYNPAMQKPEIPGMRLQMEQRQRGAPVGM